MQKSQVEIVQNAQRLAANLQAGATPVKSKNAFLSVVATFMSDPSGDLSQLRQMLSLLERGSGGHLKRGGGFGDQVRMVIGEVGRLLDQGEWESADLRSLFGWTARLLQVRGSLDRGADARADLAERKLPSRSREPFSKKKEPDTRAQPVRGLSFGAFKASGLDALQQLKEKLSEGDRRKKP